MQTPLMRYVSHCTANSVGSQRNSDNDWTRDGERSTTKTCCDGVVAQSADDSWLTARAALMARNVRCTHAVCGNDTASG